LPLTKLIPENPVESTVLVFAHKNKTLDKRTKIAKIIEKD
jgi:hypothetical protein